MTVVVHIFVADTSLLDCCDLVFLLLLLLCFFHLMLAGRQPFGVLKWFQLFSFILCQLFACLIRAAIFCLPPAFVVWSFFRFATGICGLFFLSLPQAFVYSLFLLQLFCHRHSCQTFCLCLVSACFRVSVYLSTGIILCACCLSASSLEI